MNTLFQGSTLDVYIHWLILALGIGIFLSITAVVTSCRSFARAFHLSGSGNSGRSRIYGTFSRYHSYYWTAFGWLLALHLMVTTYHLGLPVVGEPYLTAHYVAIFTAIANIVLVGLVFSSCRSFAGILGKIMTKGPLSNRIYQRFYKYHSFFWPLLIISLGGHIVFGMIHSINT